MRIFVIGDSAAQGTPAPAFGLPRVLESLLRQQYPDRSFEVVNVAMRGINSHVSRVIARECLAKEADALVVYMGNNEVVGLYSPSPGQFNPAAWPRLLRTMEAMKGTRTGQWLMAATQYWHKPEKTSQDHEYFQRNRLAYDAPERLPIRRNFADNLSDITTAAHRAGVPCVVSTVAVNLTDQPPLGSLHRTGLSPGELKDWQALYDAGGMEEDRSNWALAGEKYGEALKIDDHHAELHYRFAFCQEGLGLTNLARKHYLLARDWDALAFRIETGFNEVIRQQMAQRVEQGLFFVDAEKAFAAHPQSRLSLPGANLFHEHVHLRFDGDYLLARVLLPEVAHSLSLPVPGALANRPVATPLAVAEDIGYSRWDDLATSTAMVRMLNQPLFQGMHKQALRMDILQRHMKSRVAAFSPADLEECLALYRRAIARHPEDWMLHFNLGNLLQEHGRKRDAIPALEKAVDLQPEFCSIRLMLANLYVEAGKTDSAIAQCQAALRVDPDYQPAREALTQVLSQPRFIPKRAG
jgi:tetratricopeptide (TPR) repeat protein